MDIENNDTMDWNRNNIVMDTNRNSNIEMYIPIERTIIGWIGLQTV